MEIGPALIFLAAILFGVGLLLRRVRPDKKAILSGEEPPQRPPSMFGGRARTKPDDAEPQHDPFVAPTPPVADLSVEDGVATVTFAVPLPDGGDDVLTDVLVGAAVDVLRERRHTEDLSSVHIVATAAGFPPEVIDRRPLPGADEAMEGMGSSLLNLSAIAMDPLQVLVDDGPGELDLPARTSGDTLGAVGSDIRLPKAVQTGLRAQGVDPETMTAGQLVSGMLSLVGYNVTPGVADHTLYAQKGSERTFIRVDPPAPDGHPEVGDDAIQRFLFEFQSSGADRGLFVSDKYAPFGIFDKESREPRIRFLTRERLQKFVDGLSLG